MIDLANERLLTLNEARRTLPFLRGRRGNAVSLCTIHRWRTRGVRGVVLESAKIGGTICTSTEAVIRFVERLSGRPSSTASPVTPQRRADIERANQRLDQAGI